jgi:hypothetical protein
MDFVESVLAGFVVVHCESERLRAAIRGTVMPDTECVAIAYEGSSELVNVFASLQSLKVPFVSACLNPPADVFEFLAAEGLVSGSVDHVVWRGPGEPIADYL